MAELKTQRSIASVEDFLNSVEDEKKRAACFTLLKMMSDVTKSKAEMWGATIVGFGTYHYKYASGREADWFLTGFSPRKQNVTVYILAGFSGYDELMLKLGKYHTAKSCLYFKNLEEINVKVLKELIKQSVVHMKKLNK